MNPLATASTQSQIVARLDENILLCLEKINEALENAVDNSKELLDLAIVLRNLNDERSRLHNQSKFHEGE